ncbi:hypothetical protein LCGC14_2244290, partial [marine sediment metagenome]
GMWIGFKDKDVPENILKDIAKDTFQLPDYANHAIVPNSKDIRDLLRKSYER